jgi:hypothetical protein
MMKKSPTSRPSGSIKSRMTQPNASMSALSMPKPAGPVMGPGQRGQVDRPGLESLFDSKSLQGGLSSKKSYSGGFGRMSTRGI